MLASGWATWLMFGDIPIRQLGLWVGPCVCSDKNTLLISVSQLWYLCLVSFKYGLSCSVMSDSVTTWTVACQAPLSMGILQARILEWVAMLSSRGFSQLRDRTQVSLIAGGFFTA